MSADGFACFGDRLGFAIEARFTSDGGPSATADAWSFGEFRIYVRGRCLTRHTTPGDVSEEVRWYLAPLFRWLHGAWLPLFHEQRLPVTIGSHDNTILRFEQGERLLLDDESPRGSAARTEMQAWRKRHALWTAAAGGVLPNIWFRRQGDLCEISFDPGVTIGAPAAFEFRFSRGSAMVDIEAVVKPLLAFLRWGRLRGSAFGETVELPSDSPAEADAAERWLIGDNLTDILARAHVEKPELTGGALYPMSAEVAMFGTLTPNLSTDDAMSLLGALRDARGAEPESDELRAVTADMPPPGRDTSWSQGYELALDTLATLRMDEASRRTVDIESLLRGLGVTTRDVEVGDASLRGVAIAGEGFRPTIIVNSGAPWNRGRPGRRFTLAHELCHIIVDRGIARRVTHSSTPWAPEAVERRANAFAAMFLMPYRVVDDALAAVGRVEDFGGLRRLARRLACSHTAVLEHLNNIHRIDPDSFFRVKAEMMSG